MSVTILVGDAQKSQSGKPVQAITGRNAGANQRQDVAGQPIEADGCWKAIDQDEQHQSHYDEAPARLAGGCRACHRFDKGNSRQRQRQKVGARAVGPWERDEAVLRTKVADEQERHARHRLVIDQQEQRRQEKRQLDQQRRQRSDRFDRVVAVGAVYSIESLKPLLASDDRYEAFAARWDEAPGVGGTPSAPAARHVYNTTSTAAGYTSGYPVGIDLLWVGEYQITVIGGVWTDWARFASTLTETISDTYEVFEVRSRLSG